MTNVTLTAIRLRKIMLDSGTPLLSSTEIALTAEYPEASTGSSNSTWRLAMSDGNFS